MLMWGPVAADCNISTEKYALHIRLASDLGLRHNKTKQKHAFLAY